MKSSAEGKGRNRKIILTLTVLVSIIISFYVSFVLGMAIVYSHFFYIPIILAGIWYHKRAIYIAILLGAVHVLTTIASLSVSALASSALRALFFVLVAYVVGELSERSARKEEELRRERDKIKRILSAVGEAIYIFDKDRTILDANRAYLKTFNLDIKDVIGKKCYEIFFNRSDVCPDCPLLSIEGKKYARTERKVQCADGTVKYFDVIYVPVRDGNEIKQVICDVRDITERKEMEARLRRASRLAAIGELAASIAHELRQPLAVMNNALFLLKRELRAFSSDAETESVSGKVSRHLEIIEKEVKHANKLITDLLHFAREEKILPKRCDLNALLDEVLADIDVPSNIMVRKEVEKIPEVEIDKDKIRQVLSNIIMNAIQAMPEGGELRLKTAYDGNFAQVVVSDTGVGIPKENLHKIFEPLFTTKARGVGLGLSLCKKFVEAHGGEIKVESEVGKGSKFTIRIPASRAGAGI